MTLPAIRPVTYGVRAGIESHREEQAHEERRSLRAYGLAAGERIFDLRFRSEQLRLVGRLDMAIRLTAAEAPEPAEAAEAEAIVVDYKLTEGRAGAHFQLWLAAYALLVEEVWALPVRRAFLYSIPLRHADEVPITPALRRKVPRVVQEVRTMVNEERMPAPPVNRARCVTCEFRRFCNDAV